MSFLLDPFFSLVGVGCKTMGHDFERIHYQFPHCFMSSFVSDGFKKILSIFVVGPRHFCNCTSTDLVALSNTRNNI